jgi:hypothetical protein
MLVEPSSQYKNRWAFAFTYHAFGLIGTALSKKIGVFQPSSPDKSERAAGPEKLRRAAEMGELDNVKKLLNREKVRGGKYLIIQPLIQPSIQPRTK